METKNPFMSKRVWGMFIASLASAIKQTFPEYGLICDVVYQFGLSVLVFGAMSANTPLIDLKNKK